MAYILFVSKVNPPSQAVIDRLIRIHQTPQDDVIVTDYDTKLDNGFMIKKHDKVSLPPKKEPELKDYLGIKEYKFKERVTAEQNAKRIADKLKAEKDKDKARPDK